MKAVRIHEDGGPEVLRYEDAPDPDPKPGEVLVELRAASLNHLDLWIRKGLPSVPKPRILGADGAGIRADTGERVVINPGIDHGDGRISVVGEHSDGTHAELVAVPEQNVYPLPDEISFEEAAAFTSSTAWLIVSSAPSPRARASFSSLDEVTITRAPSAFAIASDAVATPLPIPQTKTVSPARRPERVTSIRYAVSNTSGNAAASSEANESGIG